MKKTDIASAVLLTIIPIAANAASYNYNYTGTTTLITMNDGTQTEWLHLDQTRNIAFDVVSSNLGEGGTYEGWNYATMSMVSNITEELLGFNWESEETGWHAGYNGITDQIISIFGSTKSGTSTSYDYIQGLVSNYTGSPYWASTMLANDSTSVTYLGMDRIDRVAVRADGSLGSQVGSFLYRSAVVSSVPVPGAIWLFGSGLLGLIGISRRSRI